MLSLFTYGLTFGIAEPQSGTKEPGLKLNSLQSFNSSIEVPAEADTRVPTHFVRFVQMLLRRQTGGD
jgi:hypothetical protein